MPSLSRKTEGIALLSLFQSPSVLKKMREKNREQFLEKWSGKRNKRVEKSKQRRKKIEKEKAALKKVSNAKKKEKKKRMSKKINKDLKCIVSGVISGNKGL